MTIQLTLNIKDENAAKQLLENLLKLNLATKLGVAPKPDHLDAAMENFWYNSDFVARSNVY